MVAELQIKLGDREPSRGNAEQKFIWETLRCVERKSAFELYDRVTERVRELAVQGRTENDISTGTQSTFPMGYAASPLSFQAIIE